jgi:DNA gyrase subunit A
MGTARGVVKKVQTGEFSNAKTRGIIAINLDEGDRLVSALLTQGSDEVVLISRKGQALRTHEDQVRPMGRSSRGVSGMKFGNDDELVGLLRVDPASPPPAKPQTPEAEASADEAGAEPAGGLPPEPADAATPWEKMLLLSEYGFGKRVEFSEFSPHGRGTGGQRIYTVSERTGEIVGCVSVLDSEEIMCITTQGKSIKLKVDSIRIMGRSAQGVKILSIDKPDFVIGVDRIVQEDAIEKKQEKAAEEAGDEDELPEAGPEAIEEDPGEGKTGTDAGEDRDSADSADAGEGADGNSQGELF